MKQLKTFFNKDFLSYVSESIWGLFIVFISCISCNEEQNKYNIPTGKFIGHQLGHDFHLEIKEDSSQDNYKINYIDVIDNGKYINTNWEDSIFAASFSTEQINNNSLGIEIKNFRNYDEEKDAFNKLPITITFVNHDTIEWLAFPNSEKSPYLLPKQILLVKESQKGASIPQYSEEEKSNQ